MSLSNFKFFNLVEGILSVKLAMQMMPDHGRQFLERSSEIDRVYAIVIQRANDHQMTPRDVVSLMYRWRLFGQILYTGVFVGCMAITLLLALNGFDGLAIIPLAIPFFLKIWALRNHRL